MQDSPERVYLWRQFTLREAVMLCFCATLIILTRAGLRLHLHMPGHVMFFTMFFFLLARGCVPKIGAVTLVGLITSLVSVLLGMGKGGPIVLVKFLLPALVVEVAGAVAPAFITSMLACVLVGMAAAVARSGASTGVDLLVGMEEEVLLRKAIFAAAMNGVWGGLGSLAVPAIVRRLRQNGLIEQTASDGK